MANFTWNALKSERLKRIRGVSFEDILKFPVLKVGQHPNRADQKLLLIERKGYVWAVPFIESGDKIFLKTLYPSRKHTKLFRKGEL